MGKKVFVPIYRKEDNRFFVVHPDFAGETREDAHNIALGSMLVECILLGMTYEKEIKQIDPQNTPHRKTDLNGYEVAIIAGPLFEEATKS